MLLLFGIALCFAPAAIAWIIEKTSAEARRNAELLKETEAARHAADEAKTSGEVRREVDRGSFDDAVDRL